MMKILAAVDGSAGALEMIEYLIAHAEQYRQPPQVELVTVLPADGESPDDERAQAAYQRRGDAQLREARVLLEDAGLAYQPTIIIGSTAGSLVEHAARTGCGMIMLGAHGSGAAGPNFLGTTSTAISHLATIPVLLVKRDMTGAVQARSIGEGTDNGGDPA